MNIVSKIKQTPLKILIKKVFLKLFEVTPVFTCAIRKNNGDCLYNGNTNDYFTAMNYNKDYWYADPLIYNFNNRDYLFMEVCDKKKDIGCIGVSEIIEDKIQEPRIIIKEDFHMSFPVIFKFKDEYYMLPECESSGYLYIYKCKSLPYEWSFYQKIKINNHIVDSVCFKIQNDDLYFIASEYNETLPVTCRYVTYKLTFKNGYFEFDYQGNLKDHNNYSYEERNGGNLVDGLHCVQTSKPGLYGYSLKFFNINKLDKKEISEEEKSEILPEELKVKMNIDAKITGLHTYSRTDNYEVIDIGYYDSKKFRNKVNKNV